MAEGKKSFLSRTSASAKKAVTAGLTPSLVSYFFWIGGFSAIFGGWAGVSYMSVNQFLCNIPGQYNETQGNTVGCDNCSDNIMLCPMDNCWRYAFNLTWQLDAKTANDDYFGVFQEAVLDKECNSLVTSSTDPATMLSAIMTRRAIDATKPTDACVTWSCQVLVRAVMRSKDSGSILTGPGTCTNELDIKYPWEATECSCDSMDITIQQAQDFLNFCGAMASGLDAAVYERIMGPKSACFQASVDAASLAFPAAFSTWTSTSSCIELLKRANSAFKWFDVKYLEENILSSSSVGVVPGDCNTIVCSSIYFGMTIPELGCNWSGSDATLVVPTSGTGLFGETDWLTWQIFNDSCVSKNGDSQFYVAELCNFFPFNESSFCTGRRLDGYEDDFVEVLDGPQDEPPMASDYVALRHSRSYSMPLNHATLQSAILGSDDCEGSGNICNTTQRRLQAASPAPATGTTAVSEEDKEAWTTTAWSKCTCYQQCVAGVSTRSVSCPAGVTCKTQKPTDAKPCVCKHCSDCDVLLFILATAGAFGYTAVISFNLWLAFMVASGLEEDDYVGMSIGIKCLGCICKFLPFIIKFMTYINMFCAAVLGLTALIPLGEMYSDCKGSPDLTYLAIAGLVVFALQLSVGIYMHKYKPMPPWLHTSTSNKALKLICRPFNAVGP